MAFCGSVVTRVIPVNDCGGKAACFTGKFAGFARMIADVCNLKALQD
tara:strand:+ start:107 stop:247 length:141 start_codon:yes stop_codon:yes gene_type:complete